VEKNISLQRDAENAMGNLPIVVDTDIGGENENTGEQGS